MTKFFTALAAAAVIALPVTAQAGEAPAKRTFTRDGQTYVYTSVAKGDATILSGKSYPSGRAFELTVRGNKVKGYSGGVPVSFAAETNASSGTEVASR